MPGDEVEDTVETLCPGCAAGGRGQAPLLTIPPSTAAPLAKGHHRSSVGPEDISRWQRQPHATVSSDCYIRFVSLLFYFTCH